MSEEIRKTFKECVLENLWFKILSSSSILLIFISLFLPPIGAIDPSVIAATGEIFGFAALWTVVKAIDKGKSVEVKHGETIIAVRKRKEDEEEEKIDEENE